MGFDNLALSNLIAWNEGEQENSSPTIEKSPARGNRAYMPYGNGVSLPFRLEV
jgi:hypothetical protein